MSNYIIQDTTLTSIGNAIRVKNGSTDAISVADFASSIEAIPQTTMSQRVEGTFTTDASGKATIDCGLQPDIVIIPLEYLKDVTTNIVCCFPEGAYAKHNNFGAVQLDLAFAISADITQTETGFSVLMEYIDYDCNYKAHANYTMKYIAIKYT